MVPASHDFVSHHQGCPHGGVRARVAQAAARFDQRSPHKLFVTIFRRHAARLSLHACQRNHGLQKKASRLSQASNFDAAAAPALWFAL
jgi:hypothetical protein